MLIFLSGQFEQTTILCILIEVGKVSFSASIFGKSYNLFFSNLNGIGLIESKFKAITLIKKKAAQQAIATDGSAPLQPSA